MSDRKNIKLPEPLFMALRDDKPDHMSWATYFETRCLGGDEESDTVTLEASERTKLVRAIADELAERRR